jgi:ABC-type lipoprotein release transport system permease subunit
LKHLDLIVRGAAGGDPERLIPDVRKAIASVDARVAQFEVRTQVAQRDELLIVERLLALVASMFAAIAAALAALGLYGVLAFLVTQRRREIGLRMALGAPRTAVVRAIAGDVWRSIGLGMAAGIIAAAALARYAQTIVYGVETLDGFSLTAAVVVMTVVAAVGSLRPVTRAMNVDPGIILRDN